MKAYKKKGSFVYWGHCNPKISKVKHWIESSLPGFSGVVVAEHIDGNIIDLGLRMSAQWADLHGMDWMNSVMFLYESSTWRDMNYQDEAGYSAILRTTKPGWYKPRRKLIGEALTGLNVQITVDPDLPVQLQQNDDLSFRLAIVNGNNLRRCLDAVEWLDQFGFST